jgi:hypothetical protein
MLAASAYAEGRLSEERFARIVRTDRLAARQLAAQLLSPLEPSEQ